MECKGLGGILIQRWAAWRRVQSLQLCLCLCPSASQASSETRFPLLKMEVIHPWQSCHESERGCSTVSLIPGSTVGTDGTGLER